MENRWIIIAINIICLIFLSFAVEVKDNETLIYHWDVHHKTYYYCQFGTSEEVSKGDTFEEMCLRRNTGVQHISSNGVKTYPYLAFGSAAGFILKCTNISNVDMHGCKKYVYSWCNYTCKSSSLVQNMQCQLKGPKNNITAEWSVAEPCPENNHRSDIAVTSDVVAGHGDIASNNKSNGSLGIGNTASTLIASFTDTHIIVVYSVTGIVIIIVAVVATVILCRWRQNKKKRQKHQTGSDEHIYENIRIMYTAPSSTTPSINTDGDRISIPTVSPHLSGENTAEERINFPTGPSVFRTENTVDERTNFLTGPPDFSIGNTVDERINSPLPMTSQNCGSNYTAPGFASSESRNFDSYPASSCANTENQDIINSADIDKMINEACRDMFRTDLDDINMDSCYDKLIVRQPDLEINKALDDFVSMRSAFSTWDKTKRRLEEDNGFIAQG